MIRFRNNFNISVETENYSICDDFSVKIDYSYTSKNAMIIIFHKEYLKPTKILYHDICFNVTETKLRRKISVIINKVFATNDFVIIPLIDLDNMEMTFKITVFSGCAFTYLNLNIFNNSVTKV